MPSLGLLERVDDLRLPAESPQAAYLRMLGERESNVVVKRAEMTQPQLQAETPEATMLRERSSGKFPPGPSVCAIARPGRTRLFGNAAVLLPHRQR